MSMRSSYAGYAFMVTMSITFVLVAQGASLADDTSNSSRQPDLKSWSNEIPTPNRFVVLGDFNNQAVLDRETGLVEVPFLGVEIG